MNNSRPCCTRILTGSIAALAATLLAAPVATAQLQWDPGLTPATPSGGLGAWDTTSSIWSDGIGDTTWNSLIANFGGVAGVVTINNAGVGVSASGLIFDTTGYTIAAQTAGDVLTLTGAPAITVNGLTTDTATISAIIAGGAGLTKDGAGTLVLSGANTFTGGLLINFGTVSVAADASLGAAGGVVTLDGGTLNASAAITSSRQLSLGTNFGSTVTTTTGASVWSGQITGQGGFIKNGAGSLQLGGAAANSYEGLAEVNQGTLFLNKTSGNAIGTGGVTVTSNNTAGFGAANISLSASEQIDNTAPISLFANGGVRAGFDLNNFTETVGAVTLSSTTVGSATIALGATGRLILTQDLVFNNNRNATGNTGREVMITGTGTYATPGVGGTVDLDGGPRTITVNTNNGQANTDATIEAVIENGSLVKTGTRVLRLGAVNTYSALTVNEGTVRALVDGAIPAGIPLTVSGTNFGSTATLDFGGFNYTLTPANSLVFGGGSGGATIATGAGTLTLATPLVVDLTNDPQTLTVSGNLNLNGIQDTFDIGDSANTAAELVISAVISGSATGLTKNGAGTLALAGANSAFTGPVTVNNGALALRAANTINIAPQVNAGGALLFDTALADSAAFNSVLGAATGISVNGGTIRASSNTDRTLTNRPVTVGAAGAIFDIVGNYPDFVEAGVTQLRFAGGTHNLIGSGTVTKDGGGRLQFQVASANFSGPVIVNNGTLETSGVALGNASVTNTVTVNGGNLSLTGDSSQPLITLNGGALSVTGASRIVNGQINVSASSYTFLNDFWRDFDSANPTSNIGRTITHNGQLTGSSDLGVAVNRAGYQFNNGTLALRNAANNYSGTITVGKNLNLENNSSTGSGKTIGTATIILAGGHLRLRDNGTGSNGTLAYGNDVTVTTPAPGSIFDRGTIAGTAGFDVDRSSGTNTGNTIQFDTLLVEAPQLDVAAANGYRLHFAGLTTFTTSPIMNVTSGTLVLGGGLTATGQTFTKTGAGTLRILGAVDYAGYTLTGGTLEVPTAPPGAARDISIPLGVGFSAGYVATQANLIDRITFDSAGVVALGVDSTFNPDFTGFLASLRLGGTANATLTGTITSADGTVRLGGGGGTLTLASTNAVGGPVSLDVNVNGTAPGTVVLAAANNFVGTLAVGGGMTLRAEINTALGAGLSAMTLDNGVLQTGFSGTLSRPISLGAGGGTLDTSGNAVTVGTVVSGAGAFTKAGAGTLTLTGANTYTGATAVSAGTLNIQNATALGTTAAGTTVSVGAALELQGGITVGAETLALTGTLRNVAGDNTYGGAITVNAGSTFDVAAGTALIVSASTPNTGTGAWSKTGPGTLRFTADPNNTGALTISDGVVELNHSGTTDFPMTIQSGATLRTITASLGDTTSDMTLNVGGTFDFQSGSDTMGGLSGAGLVTRQVGTAATLTVNNGAETTTFSGVIENGLGTVSLTKASTGTLTLTGTNTFTGTTLVNNGTLAINGPAGSIAGSATVNVGDGNGGGEAMNFGLADDVWAGGTLNRIGDAANVTVNGSTTAGLTYTGPANGTALTNVETIGTLTFSGGRNNVTLVPGTGNELQITTGTIARTNNGTGVLRGTNLNGTGAGSTRLVVTTPTGLLTGAAGADGATNKSIVRYLLGDTSITGAGTDFVTLDGANGVRLLAANEYSATIAGDASLRNVNTAGGETVSSNVRINSLRVTGGTTTINAGTTIGLNSGAILFTDTATVGGGGTIDFGANDGVIHVAKNTTAATGSLNVARLAGTGGLTYGRSGDVVNFFDLGGDNTVVGTFFNNQGTVRLLSSSALNNEIPMTYIPRPGTALQINGNNVTLRDLQAGAGTGTYQNGASTPATLTTYLTANRALSVGTPLQNGGTGALNIVASAGAFTLSSDQDSSATGSFELRTGVLSLTGASGTINDFTSVLVSGASTLRLTNASGSANTNRVGTVPITLIASTIDFDNNASAASFSETLGALTLGPGSNFITVDKAASGQTSVLTIDSLAARNPGALLIANSQNNNTAIFDLGQTTQSRLVFTPGFTHDDGIIGGWAVVQTSATSREFAKYVGTGTISLTQLVTADYTAALATGANPTQNVRITATPAALGGNTQINSLTLNQASATTVDIGIGNTLRIESGGLAVNNNFNANFINGTLTAGTGNNTPGELFVHAISAAANPVVIDSVIADNGTGVLTLTKGGGGVLDLQGVTNTYTGRTFLSGGTLRINADANLGAAPVAPTAGHLITSTNAILEVTENMTLNANRGIALGGGTTVISITAGTAGNGKTLTYNGSFTNGAGVAEPSLTFQSNASATNVDTGDINATLSSPISLGGSLRVEAGSFTAAAGANVFGRNLQVGTNGIGTFTQSSGSLTVGAGINDTLDVGFNTGNVVAASGTMNLTGLSQLTANVDQVRVGAASAGFTGQGTLILGINSDINAGTQVVVGSTPGGAGNAPVTSSLVLGSGITNVATRAFIVGGDKSRGNATVAAGGIVNLHGFAANTMDLLVGNYLNTATVGAASTFDMTGGTLNASLNLLAVGQKTGGNSGGTIGILTLGAGSHVISANSMVIGRVDGNNAAPNPLVTVPTAGTVNFGGGTLLVNNDVQMGVWTNNTAGTPTATGTLNITGGTVTVGGNITTTNSTSANSTLTLNGGTLDMTGGTISVDTFNAQAGTLDDVAGLFTGDGTTPAALTKTTAGSLTLTGLQNYPTLNTTAGITELDAALGTGASTINANATTNISVSQTLAALNIGAGAVVTLEADPGPAPAAADYGVANYEADQTLTPLNIGGDNMVPLGTGPEAAAAIEAVPEPGAFGLLALGALGILGRRRRELRAGARD